MSTPTPDERIDLDAVSMFRREYVTCDCGGWDEMFRPLDHNEGQRFAIPGSGSRLAGRSHHMRGCLKRATDVPAPDERCSRCGGLSGQHGLVHVRHGNGGGHNEPCPLAAPAPDPATTDEEAVDWSRRADIAELCESLWREKFVPEWVSGELLDTLMSEWVHVSTVLSPSEVAERVKAARAEAWDEGYETGYDDQRFRDTSKPVPPNPYRTEATS